MKTNLKIVVLSIFLLGILALVSCSCEGCDSCECWTSCEGWTNCEGCDSCDALNIGGHRHKEVVDEGVPATCTSAGLTEGKHCSECGEIIVAQELIIPQHNFVQNAETSLFSCSDCGATIYNGHLYAIYSVNMNWYDAYKHCDSLGGHLVTITSQNEQDFINGLIESSEYSAEIYEDYFFWTGGILNGEWKWVTGEPMEYTNWGSKEPDNGGSYQWHIALTTNLVAGNTHNSIGKWEDLGHSRCDGIICEWELDIEESTHYFTEWETIVEANCFIDGEQRRQCTHCGLVETQAIDMIEHSFVFNEATGITSCSICKAAKYNGHIYMIFSESVTWFDAYLKCEEFGGHLLTITSADEQTFVENYMRAISYSASAHMGGYLDGEKWHWVTGEPFEYSHWHPSMPDCSGGKEFCTQINYQSLGLWNDGTMQVKNAYFCEWDAE